MKYILAILSIAILISCETEKAVKETVAVVETSDKTINKKWELRLLDGEKIKTKQPIFIQLTKDNKVIGFIGCNQLTGAYSIEKNNQIKFDRLSTTKKACHKTAMALESQVLDLLKTADNFSYKEGELMLNIGKRAPLASFIEMHENKVTNKYWKLKTIEGQQVTMAPNQEREQYFILKNDGTITGFAGCNQFNGKFELKDRNRISINENITMTRKACPDVDLDENLFIDLLKLTDNYSLNGDKLTLSVGKRAPLATFEAIYF